MGNISAVNLTYIKRYQLLNPMFSPNTIKNDCYDFLCDSKKINAYINLNKNISVPNIGLIKPIRNIHSKKRDIFWQPFKPVTFNNGKNVNIDLPMFPFQIVSDSQKIKVDKKNCEKYLGFELSKLNIFWDARIYTPGVLTIHVNIFLKALNGNFDINGLTNLKAQLPYVDFVVSSNEREINSKGIFPTIDYFVQQINREMFGEGQLTEEIQGYFVLYQLQGEKVELDRYKDSIYTLMNVKNEKRESLFTKSPIGKYSDDFFAISRNSSVYYIDQGIITKPRENKTRFIHAGRRCFSSHFINSIELAYVVDALIDIYSSYFQSELNDLERDPLKRSPLKTIDAFRKRSLFEPKIYSTFVNMILTCNEKLTNARKDGFWSKVYGLATSELMESDKWTKSKELSTQIYKAAVEYNQGNSKIVGDTIAKAGKLIDYIIELAGKFK